MSRLIVESIVARPHLETAGELALVLKDEGHDVSFAFIGYALPIIEMFDLAWPSISSVATRVRKLERLLSQRGVNVLPCPDDERATVDGAHEFAANFAGSLADLKRYEYDGAPLGLGVASSLVSRTRHSEVSPEDHIAWVRAALESAVTIYHRADRVVQSAAPEHVYSFNGRFATAKPISWVAQKHSIPLHLHDRGATFEKYEVFHEPPQSMAYKRTMVDQLWQRTESSVREAAARTFFQKKREGHGIGWCSYTDGQVLGSRPEKEAGRRMVYFHSCDDEFLAIQAMIRPSGPLGLTQRQVVSKLVELATKLPELQFVIRLHPNLRGAAPAERAWWNGLASDHVMVIAEDNPCDSYALAETADVVCVYNSTMGLEAA